MRRHINRIRNQIEISLPTDENGLTSRKCSNPECGGIFKIKFGTGLKGDNLPCHCPYCGWIAEMSDFNTPEQIEYAKSVAIHQLTNALQSDLKNWGRELEHSTRNSFPKIKVDFKGHSYPIHLYQERQLETHVTCAVCTLEYSIYGLFAFCPDCGTHNSIQILRKNLELSGKLLQLVDEGTDNELVEFLVVKALETAVSTFDGFGHAYCEAHASRSTNAVRATKISFQNISKARVSFQGLFDVDFASTIDEAEWDFVVRCFQKRHLFAHKMGVIDDQYIQTTGDPTAEVGHIIKISPEEVITLIGLLLKIGNVFSEKRK